MRKKFNLNRLRFKKLKEIISVTLCNGTKWFSFNKVDEIRYGKNVFDYVFRPRFIDYLEFCINNLPIVFRITVKSNYTIDNLIDIAYSNFILEEYNMSDIGVDFKFNTIRNVFKNHFKSKEYIINHYSHRLSLPVLKLLKKEFADRDIVNLVIPAKHSWLSRIIEFEKGIIDHVRKEFNLVRAGPYNIRSPLTLVA